MVTEKTVIDFAEIMKAYGLTKLELKDEEKHILLETGRSFPKKEEETKRPEIKPEFKDKKEAKKESKEKISEGYMQKSIVVGTVYLSPAEGMDTFVNVGDKVFEGDVLCIAESMKMFNEITAEKTGTIKEILVSNGQIIEYGQPLFVIEEEGK